MMHENKRPNVREEPQQCRGDPTRDLFTLDVIPREETDRKKQHLGRKPRAQYAWSLISFLVKQLVAGASERFRYNIEMYPG